MLARSYLVSRAKLVQQRSQSAGVALEATRIPFDSLASAAEGVSKSGGHGDSAKSVTGKVNSRSVNLKRLPTNACRRCFREGHLADACDSEMPTDISLRCLGCGFYGHKLSDCRMAKSRKLSCKRCSGIGHMSYICRQDRVVESQERRSADLTKSEEKSVPADGDQGDKKKSALLSVVEPTAPAASWLSILNCTTGIEGLDDGPHDPLKANVSLRSYDVDVGDLEVSVMLDTGAGRSFIHKSVRDSLNSVYIRETRAISASATLADSTVMRFTEAIRVTIVTPQPAGAEAGVWLLVSPVLSCNLILGMNALRSLSLLVFVSSDATLLRASLTAVDVRRAISDSATRIMTCQDNPPDDQSPCALPPVFGDVGYGQSTVFVGLTPDRHVCSDGSTRMALRYTYDIPWLSDKRLPRPMEEDWARLFKKDAMLVQKLKKEGHFDAYDTVFRKYEDQGAMVEIPIKSDDFAQIDAVTALLGIIGNGRGDEDPKANTLRSTIPSLTVFRCYEHVYLSDLKMAFYQLANAPAANLLRKEIGLQLRDVLGPQRASQQLPSRGMLPANPTYSTTTRQLQNDPFLDAFVSCECYDGVQRLAMAFASVTPVPRLLSPPVTQGSKFYIFVDSSTTAYGVVITTAAFVPVRALARMHPSPRSKWSIVRKELVAILAGLMLFEDCLKVLFSSCLTPTTTLVPIVFTDNSANFHRIQGFLKGKSLDPKLPAWERRSISFAGEYLSRVDGQIYHLPGTVNPADAFSRGTMLSTPIHLDRKLHSAVHCALQLPGYGGVMLLAVNEDEQNDDDHHDRDPGLIDESWLEDIKRSQKDDPFLARILVKDPTVYLGRVCRLYEVKDGAVYHAVTGGLVVPGASCRRLIEKLHTLFGHIGFAKLYNSTYRILYLGRLADFRKVQHSCKTCFATRGHRAIHHRLGRRLLRSTAPWELVGIDLCGPYKFSDAEGESEAMLVVCVDACTKFMTVEVAHHYCNEEELLRCIQKICYRHGFPLCFYSDCDRRFSGAKLCSWLYVHGLQWVQTPPYCCRLRGWNEAPHKLLLSVVRSLILDDQDQGRVRVPWYTYVDKACWIVNNICRSGSNVDTFSSELHFTHGRCLPPVIGDRRLSDEARRFMAGLGILPVPSERALSAYLDDYRKLLVDAMDLSIAENIDQALRSRGVLAAESVVRRDLSSGFKIGDLVVRYNHHAANKLAPRWLIDKPYRITALNGSVAQLDGGEDSNGRRVLTTEFLGNLKSIPQENNVSDESEDE
ncbi:gag/pol/env polyprotein, putative [Perkinsus marinus ATCC 50983]|uniref:Gag/pol/env polyprotein, putative n=1 Tax=Perkinsus marinus (strain ATCC 50983 / TXsc) TaxID=423536 RepID=C5K885_PERM5|nr:gag/pol/env polyprotein, putative [Perkinsus marinus ATCC 50983]EER19273.1 gag/pol/env polyprotein, putative [Perkinsus marinus ATCC 50983]|eukprot:XP_002787477.1 gag/pol/env polyprotein, putative [Perkinsus marinus ATCC 50983]